jgi:hypothetical protein
LKGGDSFVSSTGLKIKEMSKINNDRLSNGQLILIRLEMVVDPGLKTGNAVSI